MKILKNLMVLFLAVLWAQYSTAETVHMLSCELQEGKTAADFVQWHDEWQSVAHDAGFTDHKIKVGVPHAAGSNADPSTMWVIQSAPSLERYGAAWDWWYSSPVGQQMAADFQAICRANVSSMMQVVGEW